MATTPCENCGRELDLSDGPVRCVCTQVNPAPPKTAPAKAKDADKPKR